MFFARPSSSYSLDSDPILSILTLVASEGGEGRGGEEREKREGRYSWNYKLTLELNAYLSTNQPSPQSKSDFTALQLQCIIVTKQRTPGNKLPPPPFISPLSLPPSSLLAISSLEGNTRSEGPTPMYNDCLTDISTILAVSDSNMSDRSVGSSLLSLEGLLPTLDDNGLTSPDAWAPGGARVEDSGGAERGSSGNTWEFSSAFS